MTGKLESINPLIWCQLFFVLCVNEALVNNIALIKNLMKNYYFEICSIFLNKSLLERRLIIFFLPSFIVQ
jgi:hypothetical protein